MRTIGFSVLLATIITIAPFTFAPVTFADDKPASQPTTDATAIARFKAVGGIALRKTNPPELAKWLDGVTTFDGQQGLPAVKKAFGL